MYYYYVEFCPIINLSLEAKQEDLYQSYSKTINNILLQYPKLESIELSLASESILLTLDEVHSLLRKHNLRLCFGSITSVDLLKAVLAIIDDPQEHVFFAPAFDIEVWNFAKERSLNYAPGVSSREDFRELIGFMPYIQEIKIFPVYANSAEDLLQALQAPYPELRLESNLSRIGTGIEINSPRAYQKIRHDFLTDKSTTISIKKPEINTQKLIDEIKNYNPDIRLIATGFGGKTPDLDILKNLGFDKIATRPKL